MSENIPDFMELSVELTKKLQAEKERVEFLRAKGKQRAAEITEVVRALQAEKEKAAALDKMLCASFRRTVPVEEQLMRYAMGQRELTREDARKMSLKLGVPEGVEDAG